MAGIMPQKLVNGQGNEDRMARKDPGKGLAKKKRKRNR